jgi:putative aldouronate transport system permease protein
MVFCILAAYPMSRPNSTFRAHNIIIGLFLFANLFDGGMLARFVVVRWVGLYDKFMGIVVPSMVSTGSIILIMNYFRSLPQEMEEAAVIDGANHFDVLFRIFVPISMPIIATITLFTMVGLWNDWFMPMLYLRDASRYPLQTYLQAFINSVDIRRLFTEGRLEEFLAIISNRGLRSATLMIATIPILLVYPLLQRYYVTGIKLASRRWTVRAPKVHKLRGRS